MNWSQSIEILMSSQTAPLPSALAVLIYLRLSWGLVLSFLLLLVVRRLFSPVPRPAALAIASALLLLTLLPGPVSPAYWLGLAFAAPSLMSAGLSVLGLWMLLTGTNRNLAVEEDRPPGWIWGLPWAMGVALGLLLLLDTFALFHGSLYAVGFSPAALGLAGLLIALYFVANGANREGRCLVFVFMFVLAVFLGLRLPSGNLWDALIDPWLWLVLSVSAGARAGRWLTATLSSGSATTRV